MKFLPRYDVGRPSVLFLSRDQGDERKNEREYRKLETQPAILEKKVVRLAHMRPSLPAVPPISWFFLMQFRCSEYSGDRSGISGTQSLAAEDSEPQLLDTYLMQLEIRCTFYKTSVCTWIIHFGRLILDFNTISTL